MGELIRGFPEGALIEPARRAPMTAGNVMAVWLQNFGGGLGAAVLAGVLAWQLGADGWAVARWAVIAGAVVFGVLMILRSAIDEIVDALDYRAMIADMDALEVQMAEQADAHAVEVNRLNGLVRTLQHDLNIARSEAWQRSAGPHSRPAVDLATEPAPPDPARDDAQKLLERAYGGQQWGKDAMRTYTGMTSTRWAAARDLLQRRGIITLGNKQTYLKPANLSDALTALLGSENGQEI